MTKLTDAELQALVNKTGLIPCDRLPKPSPTHQLEEFLIHARVCINGAVKAGKSEHRFRAFGIPNFPIQLLDSATPILRQLGYTANIIKEDNTGEPPTWYLVVAGWEI